MRASLKKEKKTNVAEDLAEYMRRRFYSLYPSELHFWVNALTQSNFFWKEGMLVCECNYDDQPGDITDDGWSTLRLAGNGRLLTSWPSPPSFTKAPLFDIPEDAHNDFLDECFSFVFTVEKIKEEDYLQYITGHFKMQGYTAEATNNNIDRSISGFRECKNLIEILRVKERITRIQQERQQKNQPSRPPQVDVGVSVRAKNFEDKATVLHIFKANCGDYNMDLCQLDVPINGISVWAKNSLKPA